MNPEDKPSFGYLQTFSPKNWKEYELIDSGNFEKLERFGSMITARPEPQAVWDKSLSNEEWNKRASASFKPAKEKGSEQLIDKGEWFTKKDTTEKWWVNYNHKNLNLKCKASLSAFKHVGIFPEQAANWDFIAEKTSKISSKLLQTSQKPKVLNLFAYTGLASVAARQTGADVTHVDSIKQVVSWARENMEASGVDNIRWIVEDAMKFVKREVRRGAIYQGIMLDPPAYGRGADGEIWKLEQHINEMIKLCSQLLDKENNFFILNMYSMGLSPMIAENLVRSSFASPQNLQCGELHLTDSFGKKLPLGSICRFSSI
jgi:23S rRNA (cytosine1962-C5)-methyltransferase